MSGGSIQIHSPSTCRELRLLGNDEETEMDGLDVTAVQPANRVALSPSRDTGRISGTTSRETGRLSRTASRDTGRLSRLSSAAQMANVQSWLTQKARRAVVALPKDPELMEVEQLCETLLQQEQELISELESTLCSRAREEDCKREMLFHKWSTRVFSPLHSRLTSIMGGSRYQNLDTEKRALFQHYLKYCNTKSVFLDTVSDVDYNPLTHQHVQLTAVTGFLDDPLLTQQVDRDTEQRIISGSHGNKCETGKRASVSRVGVAMDPVSWLAVQLIYIDSSARERARCRVKRDHNEMQGGGEGVGMLQLPHKTPAAHHCPSLSLAWPQSS